MTFKPVGKVSQKQLLLTHFKADPTISGIKASGLYRIRDLPKRISELRAEGHVIIITHKVDPTGQRYAEYRYGGHRPVTRAFEGPAPAFMGTA